MPHFLVAPENVVEGRFHLGPAESHHLAVVLRKKAGNEVRLFDGVNRSFRARLDVVKPERVAGVILAEDAGGRVPYRLRLFQGLPKGDKLEWILEKMTELGAAEIIPVQTERSVAQVPADRVERKMERWRKIVLAAAKQCGRTVLPEVGVPVNLDRALAACGANDLTLIPWEGEETLSLKAALRGARPAGAINLFIGPEGGFSPSEVERARSRGALPVTLGPLILRSETAGLAAAAGVLYELGVVE